MTRFEFLYVLFSIVIALAVTNMCTLPGQC